MRLLVLTHNYPRFPGDFSGSFIQALCEALAAAGVAVTALTPYDPQFVRSRPESDAENPVQLLTYRYIFPDVFHLPRVERIINLNALGHAAPTAPTLVYNGIHDELIWIKPLDRK